MKIYFSLLILLAFLSVQKGSTRALQLTKERTESLLRKGIHQFKREPPLLPTRTDLKERKPREEPREEPLSFTEDGAGSFLEMSTTFKLENGELATFILDGDVGGDGIPWAVGKDYSVWNGNPLKQIFSPGTAVRIAVDEYGLPALVDPNGDIYYWNGLNWVYIPAPGVKIVDVACKNNYILAITADRGIWEKNILDKSGWIRYPGTADRITADKYGYPVVMSAGGVYQYISTIDNWQPIPPPAPVTDLAMGQNNYLHIVTTNKFTNGWPQIYWYNPSTKAWVAFWKCGGVAVGCDRTGSVTCFA